MHMARPLDFMALSWVRLGRASFLTTLPQFWHEKRTSATVVYFSTHSKIKIKTMPEKSSRFTEAPDDL